MRRLLILPLTAALLALAPAMAGSLTAVAPPGFIGMSPQGVADGTDYELMREAGVTSVRLPLNWAEVVPDAADRRRPEWWRLDEQVGHAAEHGITVYFFVWGTPDWVSSRLGGEPVASARQRREWLRFLRAAVLRYGPRGSF